MGDRRRGARMAHFARLLVAAEPWRERAACRGQDPERFHPKPGGWQVEKEAKAFCARCPVLEECRAWALAEVGQRGVAGGLNDRERQRLRARLAVEDGVSNNETSSQSVR